MSPINPGTVDAFAYSMPTKMPIVPVSQGVELGAVPGLAASQSFQTRPRP